MTAERILIVDDDIDTLAMVSRVLERQGYGVSTANNGAMALDRVRTDIPNLLILDVMMPDMDGYEVARQVRSDPATAHIPIILFTARGMVDDKVTGFEAGADDYLTKPTHPAELLARVKSVLARAAARATGQPAPPTGERGRILAFVGAKGGAGTTTLALNSAIAMVFSLKDKQSAARVTLAEINPGQGAIELLLNLPPHEGLAGVLSQAPPELTPRRIEQALLPHASGLRLFLASTQPSPGDSTLTPDAAVRLVNALAATSELLLLDLGSGLDERKRGLLLLADQIVVVVEQERVSFLLGNQMAGEIEKMGIAASHMGFVLVNQFPTPAPISYQKLQEQLRAGLLATVAPSPDLAREAAEVGTPLILLQPGSLPAAQIARFSDSMLERLGVIKGSTDPITRQKRLLL